MQLAYSTAQSEWASFLSMFLYVSKILHIYIYYLVISFRLFSVSVKCINNNTNTNKKNHHSHVIT